MIDEHFVLFCFVQLWQISSYLLIQQAKCVYFIVMLLIFDLNQVIKYAGNRE